MEAPPNTQDDGWLPPILSAVGIHQAQQILSPYFGAPWTTAEDWLVFGPEHGSRLDVIFSSVQMASIVVRFDIRNDGVQFPALICRLARQLGCLFFSPDLCCLVDPNGASLAIALDNARGAPVLRAVNTKPS